MAKDPNVLKAIQRKAQAEKELQKKIDEAEQDMLIAELLRRDALERNSNG